MAASITYDENRRLIISGIECDCACEHRTPDQDIYVGEDIIRNLPQYIRKRNLGTHCVLVCDKNTIKVAGDQVCRILTEAGFDVIMCFLKRETDVDPDERSMFVNGRVLMNHSIDKKIVVWGAESAGRTAADHASAEKTAKVYVPYAARI